MRTETAQLKHRVRIAGTLEERLDVLRDAYAGQRGWLLTCGPSVKDHDPEVLKARLKGELVISVKQTLDLLGGAADFHLLNSWNIQEYAYGDPGPIVLMERGPRDPEVPNLSWDLCFPVPGVAPHIPREARLANRLAQTCNFDDWMFDRTVDRPWGPGVVYELGIYLAVHLGLRELVAVGWDIGERNTNHMEHFYDSAEPQVLSKARGFFKHEQHASTSLYNQPGYYQAEVDVIADSTGACARWLASKGVALKIVSDRSLVDADVPRVDLDHATTAVPSKGRAVTTRQQRRPGGTLLLSCAASERKNSFLTSLNDALNHRGIGIKRVATHPQLNALFRPGLAATSPQVDQDELMAAAEVEAQVYNTTTAHAHHALKAMLTERRQLIDREGIGAMLLWHQFTGGHLAMAAMARSTRTPCSFLEFGSLPGTIAHDHTGQMAESRVLNDPSWFESLKVDGVDLRNAGTYLRTARKLRLNRKDLPVSTHSLLKQIRSRLRPGRSVFVAGQFDVHTGMVPRWAPRSRVHSPHFASTLESLRFLELSLDPAKYSILFKPHPNGGDDLTSKWSSLEPTTQLINRINVFDAIQRADVVVTVLSQVAYLACLMEKPVVLLGRMQLSGSGAVIDIGRPADIGQAIERACKDGFNRTMQSAWKTHVAKMLRHVLIKDDATVADHVHRGADHVASTIAAAMKEAIA